MDELNNDNSLEEIVEDEELGVTDKMVGVLTEPSTLFQKLSNLPLKTSNWLIPLVVAILIIMITTVVKMTNPAIKADMQEKQMKQMEEYFQGMVDKGQMSQAQVDEIMDKSQENMEKGGSFQIIIAMISIPIMFFIVFFIIASVYYLVVKYGLKGDGNFKTTLTAYGLPYYIIAIQAIVGVLIAIVMGKMLNDVSVGSLMGMEQGSFLGWLLHKLDIFSIWFYAVVAIGLAKMFKSENTAKYLITIFGLWIGVSLIIHFVVKAAPFLKFLEM